MYIQMMKIAYGNEMWWLEWIAFEQGIAYALKTLNLALLNYVVHSQSPDRPELKLEFVKSHYSNVMEEIIKEGKNLKVNFPKPIIFVQVFVL